jgi:threonine/homoserine efflux transporter RhtA
MDTAIVKLCNRGPAGVPAALIGGPYFTDAVPDRTLQGERAMSVHVALQPLIALIAGILILIVPRLLNYVVAIYLIIVGVLGLLPMLHV